MAQLVIDTQRNTTDPKHVSNSNDSKVDLRFNVDALANRITELEKGQTLNKSLWLGRWISQLHIVEGSDIDVVKETLALFAERPVWFQFTLSRSEWMYPLNTSTKILTFEQGQEPCGVTVIADCGECVSSDSFPDSKRSLLVNLETRPKIVAPPVYGDYLSATTLAALESLDLNVSGERAYLEHRNKFEHGDFLIQGVKTVDELLTKQVSQTIEEPFDLDLARQTFSSLIEAPDSAVKEPATTGYGVLSIILIKFILELKQAKVKTIFQALITHLEGAREFGRESRDIELVSGEVVLVEADKAMTQAAIIDLIRRLKREMGRMDAVKLDFS